MAKKLSDIEKSIRVLERAKIRWFEHGTTEAFARDKNKLPVPYNDKAAVCWCALGAIRLEAEKAKVDMRIAEHALASVCGGWIPRLNDEKLLQRTHWNQAIRKLKLGNESLR